MRFLFILFFLYQAAEADAGSSVNALSGEMLAQYIAFKEKLENSVFNRPVLVDSESENGLTRGTVYAVIDHDFDKAGQTLTTLQGWCGIVILHLNTKACETVPEETGSRLVMYMGRKFYQTPEQAFALHYSFTVNHHHDEYLEIVLSAPEGQFGTEDHLISVRLIPLDPGKIFMVFRYGYRYGLLARTGMEAYLATLGRHKVGFTVINNQAGDPEERFIAGMQGAVERNVVRFYLAIVAYLDSLSMPEKTRFSFATRRWFDLTEQYHTQLYELDRKAYLEMKIREVSHFQQSVD